MKRDTCAPFVKITGQETIKHPGLWRISSAKKRMVSCKQRGEHPLGWLDLLCLAGLIVAGLVMPGWTCYGCLDLLWLAGLIVVGLIVLELIMQYRLHVCAKLLTKLPNRVYWAKCL